jgi:hypothetical protein
MPRSPYGDSTHLAFGQKNKGKAIHPFETDDFIFFASLWGFIRYGKHPSTYSIVSFFCF